MFFRAAHTASRFRNSDPLRHPNFLSPRHQQRRQPPLGKKEGDRPPPTGCKKEPKKHLAHTAALTRYRDIVGKKLQQRAAVTAAVGVSRALEVRACAALPRSLRESGRPQAHRHGIGRRSSSTSLLFSSPTRYRKEAAPSSIGVIACAVLFCVCVCACECACDTCAPRERASPRSSGAESERKTKEGERSARVIMTTTMATTSRARLFSDAETGML